MVAVEADVAVKDVEEGGKREEKKWEEEEQRGDVSNPDQIWLLGWWWEIAVMAREVGEAVVAGGWRPWQVRQARRAWSWAMERGSMWASGRCGAR